MQHFRSPGRPTAAAPTVALRHDAANRCLDSDQQLIGNKQPISDKQPMNLWVTEYLASAFPEALRV